MQRPEHKPENDLNLSSSEQTMPARDGYKQVLNPSGTYILFYKRIETVNSPVVLIEYFVDNKKTGKNIKPKARVAAEKIYWKDDISLAIVPYSDAMKHQELNELPENREIIIKIK